MNDNDRHITFLSAFFAMVAATGAVAIPLLLVHLPLFMKILIALSVVSVGCTPFIFWHAAGRFEKENRTPLYVGQPIVLIISVCLPIVLLSAHHFWDDMPSTIESSINQPSGEIRAGEFGLARSSTQIPGLMNDPDSAHREWSLEGHVNDKQSLTVVGDLRRDVDERDESAPKNEVFVIRAYPLSSYLDHNRGAVAMWEDLLSGWLVFWVAICVFVAFVYPEMNAVLKFFRDANKAAPDAG